MLFSNNVLILQIRCRIILNDGLGLIFLLTNTLISLIFIVSLRAGIAQLVEHDLAKVGVAGSSPVSRSIFLCNPNKVAA